MSKDFTNDHENSSTKKEFDNSSTDSYKKRVYDKPRSQSNSSSRRPYDNNSRGQGSFNRRPYDNNSRGGNRNFGPKRESFSDTMKTEFSNFRTEVNGKFKELHDKIDELKQLMSDK